MDRLAIDDRLLMIVSSDRQQLLQDVRDVILSLFVVANFFALFILWIFLFGP
jgi:hypothetical protein